MAFGRIAADDSDSDADSDTDGDSDGDDDRDDDFGGYYGAPPGCSCSLAPARPLPSSYLLVLGLALLLRKRGVLAATDGSAALRRVRGSACPSGWQRDRNW